MISCVCGNKQFNDFTGNNHATWRVSNSGALEECPVKFVQCVKCGVVRQINLPFTTDEEYRSYYAKYPPTMPEYKAKDWEHDSELARRRCDDYGITSAQGRVILDVGSGSGAFVYECRLRGELAFGCEITKYHYERNGDFIYRDLFERVNFPVDHFDIVACHDVLEHSLDPIKMLQEMFRVTKQHGLCIIDFPRFHHSAGAHHWKDSEHIWFPTEQQLVKWVQQVGFKLEHVKNPIESKVVIYARKPEQIRKTILVPPGLGDSYWSIVKMESFLEKEGIGIPEVIPVTNWRVAKYNAHERSIPFLQKFPFLHCGKAITVAKIEHRRIWNEAYLRPSRTIWRNVIGYDYFLSWNGHIRIGKPLESVDKSITCNWHPKMWVSLEEIEYQKKAVEQYDKYVVCYFPFYGTYSHWTAEFPVHSVADSIRKIAENGYKPIIVGAAWDHDDLNTQQLIRDSGAVDLTGATSITELFGLLKGATAVVGYPSGLTIMSGVFGVKTLIIWNPYYNPNFAWNTLPPDVRRVTYFIDDSYALTSTRLAAEVQDLIELGTIDPEKYPKLRTPNVSRPPVKAPSTRMLSVVPEPPKPVVPVAQVEIKSVETAVLCVLKSGGEYNAEYVIRLNNMVKRYTTVPHRFVCLTDMNIDKNVCESIPLQSGLSGWWSKLELFRSGLINSARIVYFDLDTVIMNNIDEILKLNTEFAALGDWVPGPRRTSVGCFGSGMMVWKNHNTTLSFLHDEYKGQYFQHGDQEYIANSLARHQIHYDTLQDITSGIYSYKRNCLRGIPPDARVICFHGRPRPHQAARTVSWVRNYWR